MRGTEFFCILRKSIKIDIFCFVLQQQARKSLESDHGDPITILNAYREWLELKQNRFNRRGEHVENTKTWCRRRGIEEQRFYEITKLRNQFQDLLTDCGLSETVDQGSLSSAERAIRHGELRQLKELRKAHKMTSQQRRKVLKEDTWSIEPNDDEDDQTVDIRDVEFRLGHDAKKLNVKTALLWLKLVFMFCPFSTEFTVWRNSLQLQRFNNTKTHFG